MNNQDTSMWRAMISRMDKEAIIAAWADTIDLRNVYKSWYWEQKNLNIALKAVANDAVRELEHILENKDTYGTKEIIENYKDILEPFNELVK